MNDAEGKESAGVWGFSDPDLSSLIAAAHELKSPLVLLRQLTFQLEEIHQNGYSKQSGGLAFSDKEDSPEFRICRNNESVEIARRMRFTAERALRLADNLTKAARLDDAMFALEPIQIPNLCAAVVDEMAPLGLELNTKILFRSKRISRVAIGNRELLRALLVGLVDNALNYSGGKSVEISTQISGNQVILSVADFGTLVDLREFRQLKNVLGQFKMPISTRPLSSGLGLMIAGKFAAAMNGKISVRRRAAGGMIFSAHLPVSHQLALFEV